MRRILSIALASMLAAETAAAIELPGDSTVQVRGRAEFAVDLDKDAVPFRWNYGSRSVGGATRIMLDLRAAFPRFGALYVKGHARWGRTVAHSSDVPFEFAQGDYLWRWDGGETPEATRVSARAFANERRYFTGAAVAPLVTDDALDDFDDQYGVRHDGRTGSLRWTALGAVLDDRWDGSQKLLYANAGWRGASVQFGGAYLFLPAENDTLGDRAVVKAELSGFYRRASASVSYAQSGTGDGPVFPDGRFEFDGFVGNNISSVLPAGGALAAQVRFATIPFRNWGDVSFVYDYASTGEDFAGDLSRRRRAEAGSQTGLYFVANKIALNTRLVYEKQTRWQFEGERREGYAASAHACLRNDTEAFLRAFLGRTQEDLLPEEETKFVYGAWMRTVGKIAGGLHGMVRDMGDDALETRLGVEARLNLSATAALYCRSVSRHGDRSADDVFWRFEFRPTERVFATVGYGRAFAGDGPYMLEDPDLERVGEADAVYTITLRGDF